MLRMLRIVAYTHIKGEHHSAIGNCPSRLIGTCRWSRVVITPVLTYQSGRRIRGMPLT
jgi:hypothetical protein